MDCTLGKRLYGILFLGWGLASVQVVRIGDVEFQISNRKMYEVVE